VAIEAESREKLREVLSKCSAQVVGVDGSRGTGFFVTDCLLLTCAHVVKGKKGDPVGVSPFGAPNRSGTIRDVRHDLDIDLALVDVDPDDGDEPQPAVVLHPKLDHDVFYDAAGYPKEELGGRTGLEVITYRGHRRRDANSTIDSLLVLDAGGPLIGSGLSGGALVSTMTGAVAAVVQYAQRPGLDSGGAAIPIALAAEEFPEIAELIADPPTSARWWRDALGSVHWQALGHALQWQRSLDVVVSGTRSAWEVWVDPDTTSRHAITARNLPNEVSESLFQWAERRRARRDDEVRLLGRLLGAAVFPEAVSARLRDDRLADELRVRLRVDGDSDLFDVPWEFVTDANDRHIAAEEGLGLVRVADHATPDKVDRLPAPGEVGVLGVVVQPPAWQDRMPSFVYSGKSVSWPDEHTIIARLREMVDGASGFRFLPVGDSPLENPTEYEFAVALETPAPQGVTLEVVHYIGFGHVEDGVPKLGFADGWGDVEWTPMSDVLAKVAASGARVLVVELALSRFDMELELVSPRAFLGALTNRVNAVVFTRFPVHPRQFQTFNSALYRELGAGCSIEAAVHQARRQLKGTPSLADAAGFGWFTLVTGPLADMALRPMHVDAPGEGPKQLVARSTEAVDDAATSDATRETFARP
jgi:hypothetical protein